MKNLYAIMIAVSLLLAGCGMSEASKGDTAQTGHSEAIRVAVIDSGFSQDVEWPVENGWNYIDDTQDTLDRTGHGTAVGAAVFGLAPTAVQIPLKISDPDHMTMPEMVIRAIYDAVDLYGCHVINISGSLPDSGELEDAVAYAEDQGVIVVSAAGNQGDSYKKDKIYYPAGYDTVIGVGTVEEDGTVSDYSQKNTSVFVTCVSGGRKGTSYSAAHVSGVAAQKKWESPEAFRDWLRREVTDKGPEGYDVEYGWGVLDIEKRFSEEE
ncbi:MAG: S8 family serine peptidase [Lachnospiraceae bacterium]|nr:S8 family serine peptidase [Lachnospiraceae bacterium]